VRLAISEKAKPFQMKRWTEEAVQWLEKIFEYIAKGNPLAAQRAVEGINA